MKPKKLARLYSNILFECAKDMSVLDEVRDSISKIDNPSILALSRQNVHPVRQKGGGINWSSKGAYELLANKKAELSLFASELK